MILILGANTVDSRARAEQLGLLRQGNPVRWHHVHGQETLQGWARGPVTTVEVTDRGRNRPDCQRLLELAEARGFTIRYQSNDIRRDHTADALSYVIYSTDTSTYTCTNLRHYDINFQLARLRAYLDEQNAITRRVLNVEPPVPLVDGLLGEKIPENKLPNV